MRNPFFDQLADAQTILLVGAGGGYDLFTGLPLLHSLRKAGKQVHLANLTFSDLSHDQLERPIPALAKITADSHASGTYSPELHLARYLADKSEASPIYLIDRTGVAPVIEAYRWLADTLKPDALILIDGGTDSLMRGDETGLGTPQEDLASLAAAAALDDIKKRFLVCIGFGVDTFHGVSHGLVLENISALAAKGGYLGAWSLLPETEEFTFYRDACDYVFNRMPRSPSIVNTSIIDATLGWFGDHHATSRTEGSNLFINPLMSLYWAFHLEAVTQRHLFLDKIKHTKTYAELTLRSNHFTPPSQRSANGRTSPADSRKPYPRIPHWCRPIAKEKATPSFQGVFFTISIATTSRRVRIGNAIAAITTPATQSVR